MLFRPLFYTASQIINFFLQKYKKVSLYLVFSAHSRFKDSVPACTFRDVCMLVKRNFFVIHITNTGIAFVGCAFSSGKEGSDISVLIAEIRTVTSSSEGWKDTDLGWLPNKGSHRDTQFSNNLLK